jgi:hypothetical protein
MLHLMRPVRAAHTLQAILQDRQRSLLNKLFLVDLDIGCETCSRGLFFSASCPHMMREGVPAAAMLQGKV